MPLHSDENGAKLIVAKAPPTIIPGGFWLSDLLSEVICNRFLYHLPYDRQSKLYQSRHGVHLLKQTMSDGARHLADQCGVLIDLMKRDILQCGYLRADETEARFRDPDKPGNTGRGRFWLYKGLNGNVIFDWILGRDHHHFLDWIGEDFEGILGSDAYEIYPKYCRLQKGRGKKTRRAACLAHVRRKFEEALKTNPHLAKWFLKIFGKLYQIEATLREQKADEKHIVRYRKKHSLPLIKLLQKASLHIRDKKAGRPAGRFGQAVRYLLNQGDDIETYVHHSQVEIDNNGIERDVRPLAVGRKNWLFIGSPEAGERSAVIYSLLISARHHGVDPEGYLRELIERLPSCGSDEASLRQLLPENWAAAHKSSLDPSAPRSKPPLDPPPEDPKTQGSARTLTQEARSLCERFEFLYTPTQGSWLNMAEIEVGLLVRGCLGRRIESPCKMRREVIAYLEQKNANPVPIKWQFNHQHVRIKLHSVDPTI